MNFKNLTTCFFLGFIVTSCIKEEALNAEADIETCIVPGDVLNREPIIENDKITLLIKSGKDVTALAPEFTLTSGATIIPSSGKVLDFTNPQFYEVTSEDGKWKKKYEVSVAFAGISNTKYHFENAKFNSKGEYHIFYETDSQGKESMTWASGNEGFSLTGIKDPTADKYPTYQSSDGVQGKSLKLETRLTGSLGNLLNMPIAAGNLFLGSFKVDVMNILKSTKFGVQFSYIPTYLKGYYKFKAGKEFQVAGKPVANRKDICDIYAVFYETDENLQSLDGTNVLDENNANIVSIARIDNATETNNWTEFNLPFVYRKGKSVDSEKLKAGKYSLAIIFSSSIRGDYFEGAPGSTLYIDEVELNYEDK